jgi:hypothetical protein
VAPNRQTRSFTGGPAFAWLGTSTNISNSGKIARKIFHWFLLVEVFNANMNVEAPFNPILPG